MVDLHLLEVARSFPSCCCTTNSEGNQVTAGIVAIAKVSDVFVSSSEFIEL